MTQFSLAELFGITIRESANDGSDFTNPSADYRRLFLGEDGKLHVKDSAGAVTDPYSTSASTAPTIKHSKLSRQGNITSTSTTFVVIDNTKLPAVSMASLAVGDLIELQLIGQFYNSGANAMFGDWQVVQPTLGTRRISSAPNDSGTASITSGSTRSSMMFSGSWVVAEAGTHTFQPMWRCTAGTMTLANAASGSDDTEARHIIKRWPVALVL